MGKREELSIVPLGAAKHNGRKARMVGRSMVCDQVVKFWQNK